MSLNALLMQSICAFLRSILLWFEILCGLKWKKKKKFRLRLDYFNLSRTVRIMHCLLISTLCNCLPHHAVTTYPMNNSLRTTFHRFFQIYSWFWRPFLFAMLRSVIIAINIFDQRFLRRQLKLKSHLSYQLLKIFLPADVLLEKSNVKAHIDHIFAQNEMFCDNDECFSILVSFTCILSKTNSALRID